MPAAKPPKRPTRTRRPALWLCLAALAVPAAAQSPEPDAPRRWEALQDGLELRAAPSETAQTVKLLPAGAVLSNLGCAETAGQTWCQVRPFRGGQRGFVPARALRPATGPDGTIPKGPDDSPRRAREGIFDAKGQVPCAQERGQALGTCTAAVARGTGGDATVVITFSNGFARTLTFTHGAFVRASATMSGTGTDIDWRRDSARHILRVDDQRFELPDALIFGP